MEHGLYKLKKTKIAFQQYWPIDSKLYQPKFNYPKFYTISHLVYYIWDYGSAVHYNTAHSKVMYKNFLKTFYNRTNKKKYKLQIWQYNVWYINIIAIKNVIISEKTREKILSEGPTDKTALAEMARISSLINLA